MVIGTALMLVAHEGCLSSTPPPSNGPVTTYTLSGRVSELTPAGPIPVEGVRIEETTMHLFAMTDRGGFYDLAGLHASKSTFSASKKGYVIGLNTLTIKGNTRLDIQLTKQ